MSKSIFINNEIFGELAYLNVYAYYDQPVMFSAKNQFGERYVCYSLGCENLTEEWLVIPSPLETIKSLEDKELSVSKLIKDALKGDSLFLLKIKIDNFEQTVEKVEKVGFNYLLPEDNIYILECEPYRS